MHIRAFAGVIPFLLIAGMLTGSIFDSGSALAQSTKIPATSTPTRTSTPAPPTATPFPCNTGTHDGMTYTYADLHRWNSEVASVSNSTGVPANVLKGIMWVESRGMLNARSPLTSSGYYFGLMQVGATSSLPEYMKSVTWLCDNAYNQILAGATELINKSIAIGSQNWIQVAGAYFGYGTDVLGTTTNSYMQQFATHATALMGTTPGATDWTPPPIPTATVAPVVSFSIGSTIRVDADSLNMRNAPGLSTSIVRLLMEGTSGTVLAGPDRKDNYDWYQIKLSDGFTGWVAGQFMAAGSGNTTSTPTRTPTKTPISGGTAGGGFAIGDIFQTTTLVNFRSNPGYSGSIIRSVPSGTVGTIIGTGRSMDGLHWSNVKLSDNSTGWIASNYLRRTTSSSPTATPTRTRTPVATATSSRTATKTMTTATGNTNSGSVFQTTVRLNIRQTPSTSGTILATLPSGTLMTSLGGTQVANGHTWLRVQAGPLIGWVSTNYLKATGQTAATATGLATLTRTPTAKATSPSTTIAGWVYRTTTRVNLRQGPTTSATVLSTLPSGATLVSLGESTFANGHTWMRVQAGSLIGWLSMTYVSTTGGTASTPTGLATTTRTPTPVPTRTNTPVRPPNGYISGDVVKVVDGPLNYRAAAGTSSNIIGTLPTGTTGMVLNGPTAANGMNWYQLQVSGKPNGWVAADFLDLVSASVVHGSIDVEEIVETPGDSGTTSTATPTSMQTDIPEVRDTSVLPTETTSSAETEIVDSPEALVPTKAIDEPEITAPTEEAIAPEVVDSVEELLPTNTPEPTATSIPATESPIPPTETPTATPLPDFDGDGIPDEIDSCPEIANSGFDADGDGIDDACDPTPYSEPTIPPVVERSFEIYASADTSVSAVDPSATAAENGIHELALGGETGDIGYITFYPDQIGFGEVQNATLYLTGVSGSSPISISVANGIAIDEYALTFDTAPVGNYAADIWIDAGVAVPIDLTGWIADGPVTIIIQGDGVSVGSREGGAPAWLSVTVLDQQ